MPTTNINLSLSYVESVTGTGVDNTDPQNPVINAVGGITGNGTVGNIPLVLTTSAGAIVTVGDSSASESANLFIVNKQDSSDASIALTSSITGSGAGGYFLLQSTVGTSTYRNQLFYSDASGSGYLEQTSQSVKLSVMDAFAVEYSNIVLSPTDITALSPQITTNKIAWFGNDGWGNAALRSLSDGTAGQVLTTNGAGVYSWTTVSGGGTTTNALTLGNGISGTSFNGSAPITAALTTLSSDWDAGSYEIQAASFRAKGTAGAGHLDLRYQSAIPTGAASYSKLFSGSAGALGWIVDGNAYAFYLDMTGNTASRTVTVPDRSLTLDNITTSTTSNGTGFIKSNGTNITFDNSTYLTANQTITLSGDVTGSGSTAITASISNATVTGKLLTGYVSGAGTVAATDSILQAIQKLNGNIGALTTGVSSVNGGTGAVTVTVTGTSNRISVTGGTGLTPTIDISSSYVGQNTITTLGTIATGTWQGTLIGATYGGTGVNNGSNTITLAGNLVTTGAFNTTFAAQATATITLPTATSTLLANNLGLSGGSTYIAGTAATDKAVFQATSGNQSTADTALFSFKGGNNGATNLFTIGNFSGNNAQLGLYFGGNSSTTNYIVRATGSVSYFNSSSDTRIQVGAADHIILNGTTVDIRKTLAINDAVNCTTGTTTGTKFGTATTQKIGFWNATPIVQPTTAVTAATFVANTSLIANDTATFDGYTIGQVVKALRNIGLLA